MYVNTCCGNNKKNKQEKTPCECSEVIGGTGRCIHKLNLFTTPENTITYHHTLCWSLQNFAEALFSVTLGAILTPKRN